MFVFFGLLITLTTCHKVQSKATANIVFFYMQNKHTEQNNHSFAKKGPRLLQLPHKYTIFVS